MLSSLYRPKDAWTLASSTRSLCVGGCNLTQYPESLNPYRAGQYPAVIAEVGAHAVEPTVSLVALSEEDFQETTVVDDEEDQVDYFGPHPVNPRPRKP